ncbi:anti-sigma factor [Pollutimonas harenae]|uniref:Anti-sigma factor n=1 Tax=Pollutimonas harenae TaxID=657015 RepID=A0A853GYV0_9BURK|nr:anti-sigma factor [Pollutimonas harenae]NYT85906.1 anti-sigma factor [Pollutimonas harenae]TEA70959.1 anti-sigma factor [Pollutimonas harenae]
MTGSNSTKHDILLGEYTLGLLSTSEISQAHALLGSDQQAVTTALAWEHHLLELTDLLPPVDPSPLLLQRIQNSLGHDTTPTPASLYRKPDNDTQPDALSTTDAIQPDSIATAPITTVTTPASPAPIPAPATPARGQRLRTEPAISREYLEEIGSPARPEPSRPEASIPTPIKAKAPDAAAAMNTASPQPQSEARGINTQKKEKRGSIWFWRLATLVFAAASLALALIPSQPLPPPITILQVAPTQAAILQAPGQSSTPAWVVTVDPHRNVLMSPKVRSDIPADASVQLWTHSKSMPAPRSLGLIDPNQPVTVPATLMGNINADQIFEMTLEPKGGSPTASPSGPVLFIGRMVTFGAQPEKTGTESTGGT